MQYKVYRNNYYHKLTENVLVVSEINDAKCCNNGLNLGMCFERFLEFSALECSVLCFFELLFPTVISLLFELCILLSFSERSAMTGVR